MPSKREPTAKLAGSTKLNKLLWFAECAHFRRFGQPICGVEFQKLANGPAPRRLLPIRQRLLEDGRASLERQRTPLGKVQDRLVARAEPDMSILSAEELATMTAVLEDLRDATGTELSELSHGEPAWRLTELRETIPIQACLLVSETTITPAIAAHGAKVAAALGHR